MASSSDRPIRNAAAVVVSAAEAPERVLWIERAAELAFLPGFHAFPGGALHPTDGPVGEEGTFRVAALRELFEELGILAATGADALDDEARAHLREAWLRDGTEGAAEMVRLGLEWQTERLEPVGRWLTPEFSPIRFDTRFFRLPCAERPGIRPYAPEISAAEWVSASDGLERWARGGALVAQPVVEILRAMLDGGSAWLPNALGDDGQARLCHDVLPGIQLMPLRTPTLPPATHTNAYLVGTAQALLIEPASEYPPEIDRAVRWIEEAKGLGIEVRALVATHHHVDHIGGAVALKERLGLELWAHALTAERLRSVVRVDREISDGEVLELAGPVPMQLTAVHTPGHAPGHLCFHDQASGAVLVGDMVASVGTIIVEPTDGDMALYLQSLDRLEGLGPSVLLPAHGLPILDGIGRIRQYRTHRLWREGRVQSALEGREGPATCGELVPAVYDDVPEAVWPLAEASLEAHLIKLERDGMAERVGDGWRALRDA